MNREYVRWYSPVLQKNMEILIFGHSGATVLFFPARMGRFYDYENWRVIESQRDHKNRLNGDKAFRKKGFSCLKPVLKHFFIQPGSKQFKPFGILFGILPKKRNLVYRIYFDSSIWGCGGAMV